MPIEKTKPMRIAEDLAEKLSWVIDLVGGTSADRLDPLIRKQIESWYAPHASAVERIKDARSEARRYAAAHDLGGEG